MINSLAIDDESPALLQISSYITKTPFLNLAKACRSALDAIDFLSRHSVDVLFVDVNMPDINGLEFINTLREKPIIVLTTAYSEYALDAFRADVLDYLLKPFSYNDFLQSAIKVQKQWKLQQPQMQQATSEADSIFLKSGYRTVRISFSDIKYIESMKEYVRIHLVKSEAVMTLISMKLLEEQLPKSMFMRVHRSFLVNLQHVTTIERMTIIFDKNTYIPIGEQYREQFIAYIQRNTTIKYLKN